MKKTLVSLAAASLLVSSAMAADKGVDIVTTGQAVVYYQTAAHNGDTDTTLFDQADSVANVGVQLNLDADLKNDFTFGSQLTYLGTAGLEKNLVGGVQQTQTETPSGLGGDNTTDSIALTQIFVAKKIANTTVKIGRQELPKSLSPLAYSEDWSVFKNTFDAIIAINSDIPDTTVVAAYVGGGTGMDLNGISNLTPKYTGGAVTVEGTAYMLTAQNKSLPMATITASYYDVAKVAGSIGATAIWADVAIADKDLPMGLKVGLQGGQISTDSNAIADTAALGAQVSLAPVDALTVALAYTSVDGDKNKENVAIKNFGTGIKTPLYTQMVANQDAIALDADTFMLKAAYNTGDFGTVIAQGTMTTAGEKNLMNAGRDATGTDYTDLELIYKVQAGGVSYLAAIVNQSWSEKNADNMDSNNIIRLWARYNF